MKSEPRILLAPNGLGHGHIKRLEVIGKALRARGCVIAYSTYLDALKYCRREGLPVIESIPLGYKVKSDGSVDYKATVFSSGLSLGFRTFISQLSREIQIMKTFKPDAVLSDSRASPILAAWLLGIPVALLINQLKIHMVKKPSSSKLMPIDLIFFTVANMFWFVLSRIIEWIWSLSAFILVPDFPNPYTVSKANLEIPERQAYKLKFIGPILSYKPEDLGGIDEIKMKHGLNRDIPIVYAAVSGPATERRVLSEKLEHTLPILKKYQIVMTKGETGTREVMRKKFVTIYPWADEKTHHELVKVCDVIVGRAGHGVITKSMFYRKPMVLIPIPDHTEQWNNAKTCFKLGFGVILEQRQITAENLSEVLNEALKLDPDRLDKVYGTFLKEGGKSATNLIFSLIRSDTT